MPLDVTSQDEGKQRRTWAVAVRGVQPPSDMAEYLSGWREFFDHYAALQSGWRLRNRGYHANIRRLTQFYCQPGSTVLEVGAEPETCWPHSNPPRGWESTFPEK